MATLKGVTLTLLMGPVAVAPAPREVIDALESAQVTTAVGQRSGFQIVLTYSKTSLIARTLLPAGFFDPLIRVILLATLNGVPRVLIDGPIKRQDVAASPRPGENRLTITGEDVTGYMNLMAFDGMPYPAMPSFARVALIVSRYAMFGIVPVPIPAIFESVSVPTDHYAHQQGTDLEYVEKLAKDVGYEFYVTAGPAPGMNTAHWGPQVRVGIPQPAITIDMDHASNVESLSFTADGNAATLPYAFVNVAGFPVPVPVPDVGLLKPPLSARPLVPTRMKLLETGRMKMPEVMMALLAGRAGTEPVTASGTLDLTRYGQPLEPRSLVGVRGAGLAHDGLWFVRSVTSTLGRGSWKQSFQLMRDGLISNVASVPV
ncbi:hypothetical protein [Paraburkholderia caribensis]|uniref:hypothetical protein n=1 Tax=Paraburkholderia caribensis TaxID=75105 RepID=UPI001D065373|nr:hypothetical protein [Paraburkholderia caribensis]